MHRCHIQANSLGGVLSALKRFLAHKANYNDPTSKCSISLKKEDTSLSITSGLEKTSEMISLLSSLEAKGYAGEGAITITSTVRLHGDFEDMGDSVVIT